MSKKMIQYGIYVGFYIGFLSLLFRGAEKLRILGGDKDEDAPVKDGTFWLSFWLCITISYMVISQIGFLLSISMNTPKIVPAYHHQFFGIAILIALVFVLVIKGFIDPTLNFCISVLCNLGISLTVILLSINISAFLTAPFYGLIAGIVIHQILRKKYEKGNKILWEIPKIWKFVNNRWFLLGFTVLFSIETILQLYQLSITTVWIYA